MSQNHRTPARVHRGIDGDLTVQTSLRNKGFPYEFLGLFSHRWFVLCGRLKLVAGRFHPPGTDSTWTTRVSNNSPRLG